MKKTIKKTFYRRQLANRRNKRRLIRVPKRIPINFVAFHGLDKDFCARTILPRIASWDERLPLDSQVVFELSPAHINDFISSEKHRMLVGFAEVVERSLSGLLSQSVRDFNCGHSAGLYSHSYDLGTKDEPIKLNVGNVAETCANLATCGDEVPSANRKSVLLLPLPMCEMIRANAIMRFTEPFPIQPRHIRLGVGELGKLMGRHLFLDETITGANIAYAIRQGAIRWNFKFVHSDYAPRNSTLIALRYGIFIPYPEYVVKMEVAV